jgi:MoaA/NifB/PqqE/SkfB family radical SAM enzyme
MEFWQRVHWFATSACNQKCRFCFRPRFNHEDSPEVTRRLAEILAENEVREVVFTGGEPLLLKSLNTGLEILHNAGVKTSLHTNATLLTRKRLDCLKELVDDIAIPLDSTDRETQNYLRNSDCLQKIEEALEQLQSRKIKIGIHTVATIKNISHIPRIYRLLKGRRFDYWRIYEYNPELVTDRFKNVSRFEETEALRGEMPTNQDGGVNCLHAKFLLMEERMAQHTDRRIQFVGISDFDRKPYFFLDTAGNVYFCKWFLQGKRVDIGNLLKEGFKTIKEKVIRADREGALFDEDAFIDTLGDTPLWVRAAWEGNYEWEELDEIHQRHYNQFVHLAELHIQRGKRQGYIPRNAKSMVELVS